jgi:GAF domain-containing protein
VKDGVLMSGAAQEPTHTEAESNDPLAMLQQAHRLIHDAQAALEQAGRTVAQQRASAEEVPDDVARLARAERDREDLATRLVEVEHQVGRLMTLYVATYQLHATLDPRDVQSTIGEIVVNLLGAEQFALFLRDEEDSALEICLRKGKIDAAWANDLTYSGGDPLIDASLVDGVLRFGPAEGSPALVVVPLRVQDVTVGALVILKLFVHKGGLSEEDREILDLLGAHAASALFASRVYSRAARKLRTLEGLIKLVKQG